MSTYFLFRLGLPLVIEIKLFMQKYAILIVALSSDGPQCYRLICRTKPMPFCSEDQNVAAPRSFLTLIVRSRICVAAPVLETVAKTVEASIVSVFTMSTDQKVINLSF